MATRQVIPFCVSAFSAVVKEAEADFTFVFPNTPRQAAATFAVSLGAPLVVGLPLRGLAARGAEGAATTGGGAAADGAGFA